ncbi:unnamed protein product [Trypanosoma congolense IL3000]|uniref:WGS project CAEQ00000000 data, annotated contig 1016 n=1 Tax=Trypanosoma congolense (strain IL3000) TaxID=1068625 RepID=F9W381_TRYCI|nr:unnamed protein product [Trypanosoma congolense IL3000]
MYDAVFNAEWRYVARSDEYSGKWLVVSVLGMAPGEQPHLWSGAQADVRPEHKEPWEGDVVPCVKVKLVMAFLSSLKGWPCGLFQRNEVPDVSTLTEYDVTCDAYIRKEYLRVWHIVKEGLDQWMESGRVVLPLIVIGTSGIGKSFATGSLLLYQLLHYTLERLKVVAYVVEGEAYISYREERRVVHYEEQCLTVNKINHMICEGIEGYIIFDTGDGNSGVERLPCDWDVFLISSPDRKKLKRFEALRPQKTIPVYMSCYEDAMFMAVLA